MYLHIYIHMYNENHYIYICIVQLSLSLFLSRSLSLYVYVAKYIMSWISYNMYKHIHKHVYRNMQIGRGTIYIRCATDPTWAFTSSDARTCFREWGGPVGIRSERGAIAHTWSFRALQLACSKLSSYNQPFAWNSKQVFLVTLLKVTVVGSRGLLI